jgi:hypothetical protein
MPIEHLLALKKVPREQQHVLVLAFNNTLRRLNLVDRADDPLCDQVARKVIDVGTRGVTDAVAITEIACRELGP